MWMRSISLFSLIIIITRWNKSTHAAYDLHEYIEHPYAEAQAHEPKLYQYRFTIYLYSCFRNLAEN